MYNEENDNENYTEDQDFVDIYSKRAIFWFSLIFSPIFGGVMLALNLKWANYRRAALQVLMFSIAYYFLEGFIMTWLGFKPSMDVKNSLIVMGCMLALNLVGALIQTLYFFKKYFPEDDYYPRSLTQPFIIVAILIVINLLFMLQRG
ncbi:hypothetical protein [Mucilaginibacter sp. KACC 22063]|uniref:hypothetical protein n=1 Tax=Mucilaginibacter sp. KACC 22063 TaxID=3025666 RepID=UPI00236595B6|nr:hypothetical protein [Mucilaginibacter sp. KACC 22063]WDF54439.1 hypothetical protein PQ461_15960 [Mucilaginibacter sp. KACC 22063]